MYIQYVCLLKQIKYQTIFSEVRGDKLNFLVLNALGPDHCLFWSTVHAYSQLINTWYGMGDAQCNSA